MRIFKICNIARFHKFELAVTFTNGGEIASFLKVVYFCFGKKKTTTQHSCSSLRFSRFFGNVVLQEECCVTSWRTVAKEDISTAALIPHSINPFTRKSDQNKILPRSIETFTSSKVMRRKKNNHQCISLEL